MTYRHGNGRGSRNCARATLAFALGVLTAPFASAASGAPAAADAAASVTIPFAPTLGKPIHLHSEKHTVAVRGGVEAPREETTSDDELVFTERNADGYVLRWTSKAASVRTAPERQAVMEKINAATLGATTLIQTDSRGAPVAVRNLAEARAVIASAFATMVSSVDAQYADKPQAERDVARKMLTGVVQTYQTLSDAALTTLMLKDSRMLFGYGGATLARGRPLSFETKGTIPMANASVAMTETVALRDAGPQELTLAVSTVSDPKAVKAALATVVEKMLAGMEASKRDTVAAAIAKLQDFETTDDLVLTLDARTGVIRHATHTRRVSVSGQSQTITETYAAID